MEIDHILSEIGISDDDYEVLDPENAGDTDPQFSEIVLRGENEWKGARIRYGTVSAKVSDEVDDGSGDVYATLSFDYQVTNATEELALQLEKDEEFNDYVGRVLHHIILTSFDSGDYRIGKPSDSGSTGHSDNDPEEPIT